MRDGQARLDLDEENVESVGEAVVSVVDVAVYEAVESAPRAKATAPAQARVATEVQHASPPFTYREPDQNVPDLYPDSSDDPDDPVDSVVPTTDAKGAVLRTVLNARAIDISLLRYFVDFFISILYLDLQMKKTFNCPRPAL